MNNKTQHITYNITHNNITKVINNAEKEKETNTGNQGRTPVIEGAAEERLAALQEENARLQ